MVVPWSSLTDRTVVIDATKKKKLVGATYVAKRDNKRTPSGEGRSKVLRQSLARFADFDNRNVLLLI